MGAPKNNKYWQFRDKHGRDFKYTPEALWDEACDYFEWVEANPLTGAKPVSYQGETKLEMVPFMRAMTHEGLCLFLDISHTTWDNYRNNQDFVAVSTRIEYIIKTQKFEGAAAELLNANIIARDLGLVDKRELDNNIKIDTDGARDKIAAAIGKVVKPDTNQSST